MSGSGRKQLLVAESDMTEKAVSFEVYPMRGHAHGEWYGALENIVDREDAAEYWALFGVTLRGNKHCLAEFRTKAEAEGARRRAIDRLRRGVLPLLAGSRASDVLGYEICLRPEADIPIYAISRIESRRSAHSRLLLMIILLEGRDARPWVLASFGKP